MKYYRILRKSIITEEVIVRAGNSSDARMIAEDDADIDSIKTINENDGDWEVSRVDIDSELNCAKYFKQE